MANAEVREPDGVEDARQAQADAAQVLDADAMAAIVESREAETRSGGELDERDEIEAFGEDRLPMGPPLEEDDEDAVARAETAAEEEEEIGPTDPVEAVDEG